MQFFKKISFKSINLKKFDLKRINIKSIKSHQLWNHRKDVLLYICIMIALFGSIKATTILVMAGEDSSATSAQAWTSNCYRIHINGTDMGLVETREVGEAAIKQALGNLITELGYDPDAKPEIRYYEEYSEDLAFASMEEMIPLIQQEIKDGIDVIKVKAYAMKISDDFIVSIKSEEDVKQVLENAQKRYISGNTEFDVVLSKDEHNSLIASPQIITVQESLEKARNFATAAQNIIEKASGSQTETETTQALDPMHNGVTVGAEFTQEIMIVETFVDETTIKTVEEATEMITKENEAPKVYVVQSGDSSSVIAANNNMDLETLYALNPGLASNEQSLQIGQELTVMVPEAELSVTTTEEVIYNLPIERETTYVENPDVYEGTNKVIDEGSDGTKTVTALLTKINGAETSRTVTAEVIAVEPVAKVIEKGTKALPPKGATGEYIMPVSNYTFSSGFGYRWGSFHAGVDLAAPTGTTIRAADGGVVTYAGWYYGYGYLVTIDHGNGVETRYGHCSSISVSVGQQVAQYEEIAKVGSTGNSTGPHCHFELRFDGTAVNPMNYLSN